MTVRRLKEEDYEMLKLWWRKWRWTPPVQEILPDNGTGGFIVYDEDIPVAAGFLYDTNSKIAWVEWIVSNFDYKDKQGRDDAIKMLLIYLEALARAKDKKALYSLLKSQPLINKYKEMGFIATEAGYTEMIKTWQ